MPDPIDLGILELMSLPDLYQCASRLDATEHQTIIKIVAVLIKRVELLEIKLNKTKIHVEGKYAENPWFQ